MNPVKPAKDMVAIRVRLETKLGPYTGTVTVEKAAWDDMPNRADWLLDVASDMLLEGAKVSWVEQG